MEEKLKEIVVRFEDQMCIRDRLKTQGNFNNDIGAPLTLLNLGPEHQAAVVETGMNHFGEIRYLGEMVRPTIAVISNIGDAHVEFLGSREGILKAKCEIFENLQEEGVAVLNGDDALLNTCLLYTSKRTAGIPMSGRSVPPSCWGIWKGANGISPTAPMP